MKKFIFTSYFFLISLSMSHASLASNVEYHGYYRAGIGTNSKGGDQTCFKDPGPSGNAFRLGNECSNYGELSFIMRHLKEKKTSHFFDSHIRFAFNQDGDTNWESANSSSGEKNPIAIRELYFRGGNFNNNTLIYWIGKRYLREPDLYMNDWFYFANTVGNGAGIEGIKFFKGDLLFSVLKETTSTETKIGKLSTTHFDLRVKDLPLNKDHFLNLWTNYAYMPNSSDEDGKFYTNQRGYALGFRHDLKLKEGSNHFSMVYGKGLMSGLSGLGGNSALEATSPDFKFIKEAQKFQIVEHITTRYANTQFHFMSSYQYATSKISLNPKATHAYTIGFSPAYYFDDHYHLSAALGGSLLKRKNQKDQTFKRITIAPGVSLSESIWSRPVLRVFYTKSFWSNSLRGSIGDEAYKTATSGSSYGFQAESWF